MRKLMHTLFGDTAAVIRGFGGNARGCLVVEPLWGIPYNLFVPYVGIYMLALGCTDIQVGVITAVSLLFQTVFAFVSGFITDRLGRKRTSIIFDLIGWSIPTAIWGLAWGYGAFLIAGAINGFMRVVHNSWNCLIIEDTPPKERVHVYTYIYIAGLLAGFFAPLAGLLVEHLTLVPAMRILYGFAFVCMTAMFIIRNQVTTETRMGIVRMRESREVRFSDAWSDYKRIARQLAANPLVLIAFGMVLAGNIQIVLKNSFLSILLNRDLGFPKESVAFFPAIQSVVMLAVYLLVMPRLGRMKPWVPMLSGSVIGAAGYLLLVLSPGPNYIFLIAGAILTAAGTSVVFPMVDSLMANAVEERDRAMSMSVVYLFLFGLSAPFGYIGGALSAISSRLTFLLVAAAFIVDLVLVVVLNRTRLHAVAEGRISRS